MTSGSADRWAAWVAVAYRLLRTDPIVVGGPDGCRAVPVTDMTTFAELRRTPGEPTTAEPHLRAQGGRYVLADSPPGWGQFVDAALAHGSSAPHTRVAALRLLGATAESRAARDFGGGGPGAGGASIPKLVARNVRARPEAAAVSCGELTIDYRRLWSESGRIAAEVRSRGLRPGEVVGVLYPPSVGVVVALLGILRAGGAYLAVDAGEPVLRVAEMFALAGCRLALVHESQVDRAPANIEHVEHVEYVDGVEGVEPVCEEPIEIDDLHADPEQVAYVSFTSGSTGAPKGVAVAHRGVVRLLRETEWADFGPDDVFLQVAPIAFDASTIEIWGALLNGGRVAVHDLRPLDLDELTATVISEKVSALLLTTGLFHSMVTEHPEAFGSCRHVMTGGDVVSPAHVERLFAARPDVIFTNGYGPTENTSYTTCWTSSVPPSERRVPIGTAINGTNVRVLDAALRLVPAGVCGEVYTGGLGLAHGYVGRPGLTAERFIADPFTPGERLYRTGDLAMWRADGVLDFVGRGDRQVKVRGFRVEPADVEEELRRCPEVREAAVVAQRSSSGQHRLIGYIVPTIVGDRPEETVRATLAERLAAHLIPTLVVRKTLTLTSNGKPDHGALPASTRAERPIDDPFVAPRTEREAQIAELWGQVLEVEPVGVTDTFFDLGGYSLLAADLLQLVREHLGVDLSARYLYEHASVAEFAAHLPESGSYRTATDACVD